MTYPAFKPTMSFARDWRCGGTAALPSGRSRAVALILAGLVVSGCQAFRPIDPMADTRFSVGSDGRSFSYVGFAAGDYALKTDEADRRATLVRWLRKSQICPAGYKVTARKEEKRPTSAYTIYYAGVCT